MMTNQIEVSAVLPARNEAGSLDKLLPTLLGCTDIDEVIVVNDGSTDETAAVCRRHGVKVICHPYPMGNGAAIKSGARVAAGRTLIFMDADGQHDPADIPGLLAKRRNGFSMVVGQRALHSHASLPRRLANAVYNRLASLITGHRIGDLTSGFRVVDAQCFREFLFMLPNGFSYPATSTMAFFRAGYPVTYMDITAGQRQGKSHIKPLRDGARFFVIIFKIGTLYSPLKIFAPASIAFFLTGLGYYAYTFITASRFTNMGVLLFITSILVFLFGLLSEQITILLYGQQSARDENS